jgi:hypothetical protein
MNRVQSKEKYNTMGICFCYEKQPSRSERNGNNFKKAISKKHIFFISTVVLVLCCAAASQAQDNTNATKPDTIAIPEVFPAFIRGTLEWRKFLERNLRADVPIEFGAPAGLYEVSVRFTVNVDGNVSSVETLTNLGYGMEAEVIRLISKSKWSPGLSGGKPVKCYMTQSIVFIIKDE